MSAEEREIRKRKAMASLRNDLVATRLTIYAMAVRSDGKASAGTAWWNVRYFLPVRDGEVFRIEDVTRRVGEATGYDAAERGRLKWLSIRTQAASDPIEFLSKILFESAYQIRVEKL